MGMIQDFQKADEERRAEVATMLSKADAFVKELAKGSAQRASDVASMLGDFAKEDVRRRSEVKTMQGEVKAMLGDFAKGDAERRSEIATMLSAADAFVKELAKGSAQRASEVATMLSDADAFVKELAKGSAQRASEVASMLKKLAKQDAERRAEVAAIHEMVWGKVPAKKVAVPPVEKPSKEVPLAGELRDRVFAYLANHPDGTRLVEMEEEFGVSRIEMARVLRDLMADNKVEKRELLYFAI